MEVYVLIKTSNRHLAGQMDFLIDISRSKWLLPALAAALTEGTWGTEPQQYSLHKRALFSCSCSWEALLDGRVLLSNAMPQFGEGFCFLEVCEPATHFSSFSKLKLIPSAVIWCEPCQCLSSHLRVCCALFKSRRQHVSFFARPEGWLIPNCPRIRAGLVHDRI